MAAAYDRLRLPKALPFLIQDSAQQAYDVLQKKKKKAHDSQLSHLPRRYQETTPLTTDADGDVYLPTQGTQLHPPPLLLTLPPDSEKCSPQITSRNDMYSTAP